MDPTACALGRWYHGPGRMLAGSVAYHELDRPHRRLHEIGQQLREAVEAQASSARVMNLIRQLASQSSAIVWYLQSLQHEAWAALDVQELDQLRGLRD